MSFIDLILFRAVYDVKATDMGSQSVMFKAEVDIDGRELARSYLEKIDIHLILEVKVENFFQLSDTFRF